MQELHNLSGLGVEVAVADLRSVLHLLDPDVARLAPGLLRPLRFVEFELPVVHDPAHGRAGERSHLHEIQILPLGDLEGFRKRLDPELAALWVHQSNLASPDAVVDPGLVGAWYVGDRRSVLSRSDRTFGTERRTGRRGDRSPALHIWTRRTR
jgi:hypothetical protein